MQRCWWLGAQDRSERSGSGVAAIFPIKTLEVRVASGRIRQPRPATKSCLRTTRGRSPRWRGRAPMQATASSTIDRSASPFFLSFFLFPFRFLALAAPLLSWHTCASGPCVRASDAPQDAGAARLAFSPVEIVGRLRTLPVFPHVL